VIDSTPFGDCYRLFSDAFLHRQLQQMINQFFIPIKTLFMKQKFILSLMAIAIGVLSASAQGEEQIVVNAGNAEHINIANDMDVVLLPGQHTDQSISLNGEATKSISLRLSDNSMTISPLRQLSRKERIKVYLYVNNLKTISVESNSLVKTIGVLDAPKLEVFINSDSRVHVKTTGDVKAHSLSDTEVRVKYLSDNRIAKR
jgi:Putative auto-transporter adhesin, head GIN domain